MNKNTKDRPIAILTIRKEANKHEGDNVSRLLAANRLVASRRHTIDSKLTAFHDVPKEARHGY